MKIILIIIGMLGVSAVSWAQSILSGHVIDQQTKEPIIGASVYIRKNNIG
jgi:hypothetical protein